VRHACIDDIDVLTVLFEEYRVFYDAARQPEQARAFLVDRIRYNQSFLLLAEEGDGRPVGFVQIYPTFTSVGLAQVLILNDLFVDHCYRGRGVASELLTAAVDFARRSGALKMRLSTAVVNHAAQRVYAHAGWRQSQEYLTYEIGPLHPLRTESH